MIPSCYVKLHRPSVLSQPVDPPVARCFVPPLPLLFQHKSNFDLLPYRRTYSPPPCIKSPGFVNLSIEDGWGTQLSKAPPDVEPPSNSHPPVHTLIVSTMPGLDAYTDRLLISPALPILPSSLPPTCVLLLYRQQQQPAKQPDQRRGIMRGRRSRSQSRARDVSSAAPSEAEDDDDVSSPMRGAGGASLGKKRFPRGGVLGSKLLRRSQTTGDMDAPQPKARVSVRQDRSARYCTQCELYRVSCGRCLFFCCCLICCSLSRLFSFVVVVQNTKHGLTRIRTPLRSLRRYDVP